MKRFLAILLMMCMLLCGCGSDEEEQVTDAAQTEVTEDSKEETKADDKKQDDAEEDQVEEETETEETVIRHPLTGEVLDEAWTGTAAASTINNAPDALPQYGISQADLLYEIEVEGGVTRMLAVFTDLEDVETVGPVRSARTFFNNIATSYSAPLFHCGGSKYANNKQYDDSGKKIENLKNVNEMEHSSYFFRDTDRYKYQGYAWEHTLFTTGENMVAALQAKGYDTDEVLDFGLQFSENPELGGESANEVIVTFRGGKTYTLTYNADTGLYEGSEFGNEHIDAGTGEVMQYRNVLVLYAAQRVNHHSFYDLIGTGNGHFACDGEIIPINWSRESVYDPFVYTLEDGSVLTLGVGNSYIGIVSDTRTVAYN